MPLSLRKVLFPAIAVFTMVVLATAFYSFTRLPLYEGVARSDDLLPRDRTDLETEFLTYDQCAEFANSSQMTEKIAARITGNDLDRMLAHYAPPERRSPTLLLEVLAANRRVSSESPRGPLIVTYRHPDPVIAARVANMLIDELIAYTSRVRVNRTIGRVNNALQRRESLSQKITDLTARLASLSKDRDHRDTEKFYPIQDELEAAKQALNGVDQELKALNTFDEWELRSVRRIETAPPPSNPVYPSHRLHLGIGVLSGLVCGGLTVGHLSRSRASSITLS